MILPYQRLVGLFCVTSGEQNENLGCDEEPIVAVCIFVHELESNETLKIEHYEVTYDADLSECEEEGKQSLSVIIKHIESLLSESVSNERSCLCTYGHRHLRMVLHPACFREKILLPDSFYKYFDLKHFIQNFYDSDQTDSEIQESIKNLEESKEFSKDFAERMCSELAALLKKMVEDGCTFSEPEYIMKTYQPKNWNGENVEDEFVVKARGLPWHSTETDVANFFRGLNINKGGVALCMTAQGKKNGEAVVRFETQEQRTLALKRHKHHLGSRYIEVFRSTGKEFLQCLASSSKEARAILMQKFDYVDLVVIRMRGLPYTCKPSQVVEFFRGQPSSCEVLDEEGGVLLIYQSEGKNTGDAFVLFANDADASKALTKHKQCIGSRYIELFKSTIAEVQQVLNKSFDPRSPSLLLNSNPQLVSYLGPSNMLQPLHHQLHFLFPNQNISRVKDCVRIVGLPPETSINDLVVFFSDHVRDIKHKGVHLVYDMQGLPTGEAFIEMVGERQADFVQESRSGRMILVSGHRHFVYVHKCSFDEMASMLHGSHNNFLSIVQGESFPEHQSHSPGNGFPENAAVSPLPLTLSPVWQYGYQVCPYFTFPPNNLPLTVPLSSSGIDVAYVADAINEKAKLC